MDEDLTRELEREKRIEMADEKMRRKEVLELALKTAATNPDYFVRTLTNKERTLGAMIVREAKTIYEYLYPEGK